MIEALGVMTPNNFLASINRNILKHNYSSSMKAKRSAQMDQINDEILFYYILYTIYF